MATSRDAPYVWTTWITKLIVGEAHCEWASWFRAHYRYDKVPSDFPVARWTAEHTAMVRAQAATLRTAGYGVFVEAQNAFQVRGRQDVTLAGKPDIVALRDNTVCVIDCKTGIPRHSDTIQVLIYMLILPHVRPAWKAKSWQGRVQYRDTAVEIPPTALDDRFRSLFRLAMAQVGGTTALPRVPSYAECRFCDISRRDCPQRIDTPPLDMELEHDLF